MRPAYPGVPFFLAMYRDKLRLLLSERDVPFRRASVETRTLVSLENTALRCNVRNFYRDIIHESRFCGYRSLFLYQFLLKLSCHAYIQRKIHIFFNENFSLIFFILEKFTEFLPKFCKKKKNSCNYCSSIEVFLKIN